MAMSIQEARKLVSDLRKMGINNEGIRTRLVNEGFSAAAIDKIIHDAPTPVSSFNQALEEYEAGNEGKFKRGDVFSNYGNGKIRATQKFERGGCLSAYLIFNGVAGVIAIFAVLALLGDLSANSYAYGDAAGLLTGLLFVGIIVSAIQFLCVIWLWQGKRKGYQGLLMLMGVSIVINIFTGEFAQIGSNVVGLIILWSLVNPKEPLLR